MAATVGTVLLVLLFRRRGFFTLFVFFFVTGRVGCAGRSSGTDCVVLASAFFIVTRSMGVSVLPTAD